MGTKQSNATGKGCQKKSGKYTKALERINSSAKQSGAVHIYLYEKKYYTENN